MANADAPRSRDLYALSPEISRLLIESVQDYAIYVLEPDGRVASWNPGAEKLKGYRADEIIGKNFSLFFTPHDVQEHKPQRELDMARERGRHEEEGYRVRKDGSRFWASVVLTPIREADGSLFGFAKITRDLTARREAEQTARELVREQAARSAAEAAEARVRDSEQRYRVLSRRLEGILEGVGDGMTVHDKSGAIIFANSAAARASGYASIEELLGANPDEVVARFDVRDENGVALDPSMVPAQRVLRGEPFCSQVLRVRDRITGEDGYSLVRASGVLGPDGTTELAINIWHDVSEERRREQDEKLLGQATLALSASLDSQTMLSTLATFLVPGLADWCTIHVLEGDELRRVSVAHQDPDKVRFAEEVGRRYPPDRKRAGGVWSVLKTGHGELYENITDDMLQHVARDAEHATVLRQVGMKSVIIVPIRGRAVLGAISLVTAESGKRYDTRDLALARELGLRAGSALENARLYAAEKRARDQVSLLARASEMFAASASYDDVLRNVVEIALPQLGDFAFFDIVEGAGVRRTARAFDDPEVDALLQATEWQKQLHETKNVCALSSGSAGFHPRIDDAWQRDVAESPEHLALLKQLALCSLITVPLDYQGEVLGSLTVCYGKSGRHYTADDLKLTQELARRAAMAITQVRLYARAQEAARSAEEAAQRAEAASRVKDEFLATVSHELRTPLSAILGWSAVLRTRGMDEATAKAIDVIHRNAIAQSKIIEDILDVSRIITGKLALDLHPVDVLTIVRDAIEVVRPSALAKEIAIELSSPCDGYQLVADPQRLQQIFWNLLSNAVKFSERGDRINVELQQEGAQLRLTVRDTGQGIDPEFLPFVFDRFKQADSSTTRRFGGLGLGLSIVRHLSELHGGRVEAHSAGRGQGATFTVSLPVRAVYPSTTPPPFSKGLQTRGLKREGLPRLLEGMRVLVVDDEPDARDLVEMVLTRAGASVETAASAQEGLTVMQRFRPQVLVSDIGMPNEDGYSFIERVRSYERLWGAQVGAIALSAYTREQDKAKALASGFNTHLGKPVDPTDLIKVVSDLAARVTN